MRAPERGTFANPTIGEKDFSILVPGLGFFRRPGDCIENALLPLRGVDQLPCPIWIYPRFLRGGNHLLYRFAVAVISGRNDKGQTQTCPKKQHATRLRGLPSPRSVCRDHRDRTLFSVLMALRIPKPSSKVTIDVPPKLTKGSGTPTTGRIPATIPMFTTT